MRNNDYDDIYFSNFDDTPRKSRSSSEYEDIYSNYFPDEYEEAPEPRRQIAPSRKREIPTEFEDYKPPRRKAKKKKRGCGCLMSIVAVFLVLLVVAGVAGAGFVYNMMGKVDYDGTITVNKHVTTSELKSDSKITNILLMGVDRRSKEETASRSDTMILFSIDRKNKQLKMASFLRDILVDIPGEGEAKLNSASTWGGPQLVIDTIEVNFGIDIEHYVLVDFEMFQKIIDDLGGIDVTATKEEANFVGSGKFGAPDIDLKEGVNHLDGNDALWYSRMRYLDSDFKRAERQRKVINAIIKKAASANPLELVDMAKGIMPYIQTDIPQAELTKLAIRGAAQLLTYDVVQMQVPVEGTYKGVNGRTYYFDIDFDANKKALYEFVFEKVAQEEESTTKKKS